MFVFQRDSINYRFVCAGKLLHFSSLVLRTVLLLNGTAPTAELYALALLVAFCAERTSEQIDAEHMLMRNAIGNVSHFHFFTMPPHTDDLPGFLKVGQEELRVRNDSIPGHL